MSEGLAQGSGSNPHFPATGQALYPIGLRAPSDHGAFRVMWGEANGRLSVFLGVVLLFFAEHEHFAMIYSKLSHSAK